MKNSLNTSASEAWLTKFSQAWRQRITSENIGKVANLYTQKYPPSYPDYPPRQKIIPELYERLKQG